MKLKFLFDKEKEKEKIDWAQRTKGMGELPKYDFGKVGLEKAKEIEIPTSNKLKFTADVGIGMGAKAVGKATLAKPKNDILSNLLSTMESYKKQIDEIEVPPSVEGLPISEPKAKPVEVPSSQFGISELNKPEQMGKIQKGIIGVFGTWEAKKRAMPELQSMEDFGNEVFKQGDRRNQIAYIYEALTGTSREESLAEMEANFQKFRDINPDIDERTWKEYYKEEGLLKTLIMGPTKGKYDEAIKIHNQLIDIATKVAEPGRDLIGQLGWSGVVLLMGAQFTGALYSAGLRVKEKMVTGDKLKAAVERIQKAYIPKTDKFKSSLSNNDLAVAHRLKDIYRATGGKIENLKIVKDWGVTEKGFKVPQATFLYAGLPPDEIVKSLVKTGKLTADIAKELSLAKPELVSQVIQNLSIASPAIASKLAPELVKLIPKEEVLKKVEPEVKEETPKVIPKEPTIPMIPSYTPYEKMNMLKTGARVDRLKILYDAKGEGVEKVNINGKIVPIDTVIKRTQEQSNLPELEKAMKEVTPKVESKALEPLAEEAVPVSTKDFSKFGSIGQFKFTGEYSQQTQGYYKAKRSKGIVYAPIYKNEKGEILVDMSQAVKKRPDNFIDIYTQATAKPAEKVGPKVEVKAEEVPKPELASLKQIKKAHAIANSKAMISEKGKVKPQYRKTAEAFTGKKSIKDMTPEEAEMFIDQLNRLPEPKYKGGKLVAPSIPRTMKLVTQDFFKRKYGEPTPIWLLTDQAYYATKLGIKPLVEPFERGKQEFDLEFRQSSNLVDRMVVKLNKVAKTPGFEKIRSKVKSIPTKAEGKMAELVNKHEATPSGLSPQEEDIFKYFRNLSKDIWRRENEIREKVDLPPIKYKIAYFRHTADAMAKEMLEGKYPFPQGIKYWSEKMVGKKIFNPMEFQRKLSDDLIDLWSKDIRAVTKSMLWNGLKEIYLAQPAKFLNEQLNAISKDLPEYKNLTPREKAAYDQTRVMPASTKKWLINYINQVIKGQENELDASLNRIVTKSGLKGIFDKVLAPFGRSIGRKPITNVFSLSGRIIISGVMGWVPRQIMRNFFQPVQNLALYGIKATIKACLPASVDKNLKELMSESLFRKSYTGYEELPTNLMAKLEKVWLTPYGIVAVNNAKLGMKAAYWNILELIRNPKFKKHGWADPQRTKDTPKGFLYPNEKEKLLKEMEFGASCTQYQYIPIGMPGVFRYKALIPLTRLQSWWMNYFTKFNREAIHRGFKGRPSWSGEDGPTLPWSRRVNYLKYLIIGGAMLTSLGYKRSFMLGVAPTYLSPAGQLALGIYNYAVAGEDWKKEKALRQIYYSWKAFIPGSLAWRDFLSVWKGEKDLDEILFYGKKEKKKAQPPLKITVPKSGELKFTEPEVDIESDKLKFTF